MLDWKIDFSHLYSMDHVGLVGAILLAVCAIPEAVRAIRNNRCDIGWTMLITWLLGEVAFGTFILYNFFSWQSVLNYGINTLTLLVLIKYKIIGARNDRREEGALRSTKTKSTKQRTSRRRVKANDARSKKEVEANVQV